MNRHTLSIRWTAAALLAFALSALVAWELDERTRTLLTNTVSLAAGSCVVGLPSGTILAVLIHRTDIGGRRTAWSLLVALLFLPIYLQAAGWDGWLGRQTWLGAIPSSPFWQLAAAAWIHGIAAMPWVAVIVGAGLQQVPAELEELALLDMSPARVIRTVTLPMSRGAFGAAAWWTCVLAVNDMTVTDLYQVRTFAEEIYVTLPLLEPSGPGGDTGAASLPQGLTLLVLALVASLIVLGYVARHDRPATPRSRLTFQLGPWQWPLRGVLFGLLALALVVPISSLVRDAGMEVLKTADGPVRRWSAAKLVDLVASSPWHFHEELGWTLIIAGLAAAMAMGLALPLAWQARQPSLRAWPAVLVTSAAAALPGPLVALAVITVLNQEGSELLIWLYDRTVAAPVVAAWVRALPVAVVVCWWAFRTVPPELLDMSRLDGCSDLGQLVYLAIPLRLEVLLAGFCIAAAVSAADLSATLLVTPPGVRTLAMRIFGLLHAGVDDQVAAVCLFNAIWHTALALLATGILARTSSQLSGQP